MNIGFQYISDGKEVYATITNITTTEELQQNLDSEEKAITVCTFLSELKDAELTTDTMRAVIDGLDNLATLDIEVHGASRTHEFVVLEALFARIFKAGMEHQEQLVQQKLQAA